MKGKSILTFALLILFSCGSQVASARNMTDNRDSTVILSLTKKENIMKSNYFLIVTLVMLFAFSFQAAIGQDEKLDSGAKEILDQMATFRKILENGDSYDANSSPAYPWNKNATSVEERQRFYQKWEPTPYTKKKFDEALDAIAKLLNNKNRVVKEETPLAVKFLLDEVSKITEQVNEFDPTENAFIVNPSEGEWLLRAVSMKEREKWAKDFFKSGIAGKKEFWQKLDALAESGKKKIPTFKPNTENFAFHNAAEEELMKRQLGSPSGIKIHKIGQANKTWEIVKNNIEVPIRRFKRGYIWARNPKDDHAHCHLYQINIIQDYLGGGKYGESYFQLLGDWLAGCQ